MADRIGPERPRRHSGTRSSKGKSGVPDPAAPDGFGPLALRIVMFLVTAVVVGLGYRSFGGDLNLVPLVSALAGLGAVGAVEFADRMGLL